MTALKLGDYKNSLFHGENVADFAVGKLYRIVFDFKQILRFGLDQPRRAYVAVLGVKLFCRHGNAYKFAEVIF